MGNEFASKCCTASNYTVSQPDTDKTNTPNPNYTILPTPPKLNQTLLTSLLKNSTAAIIKEPFESEFDNQQKMIIVKTKDDLVYHGPIDNNQIPHGYSKIYRENGTVMIGQFDHGQRIGQHYLFLPDGSFYKGVVQKDSIAKGEYHGQEQFKYVGQFRNYQLHGRGQQSHKGYHFEGEYLMGKRVKGLLRWELDNFSNTYSGKFDQNQLFDGVGELVTPEGTYKGQFKKGCKEGEGFFYYNNGLTYKGEYLNGQKNGRGKIINYNGGISYDGEFLNGLPHGKGKVLQKSGKIKEGQFQYGVPSYQWDKLMQQTALRGQSFF